MHHHETIPERDPIRITEQLGQLERLFGTEDSIHRLQTHQQTIQCIIEQAGDRQQHLSYKFMSPNELIEHSELPSFINKGKKKNEEIDKRIRFTVVIPKELKKQISGTYKEFEGILDHYHGLIQEGEYIISHGTKEEWLMRKQQFQEEQLQPFYQAVTERLVVFDKELQQWSCIPEIKNYLHSVGLINEEDIQRWSRISNSNEPIQLNKHEKVKDTAVLLFQQATPDNPLSTNDLVAQLYSHLDPVHARGKVHNLVSRMRKKFSEEGFNVVNKNPRREIAEYYLESLVSHEEHELFNSLEISEETMLHLYGSQLRVQDVTIDLSRVEADILYRLAKNGKEANVQTIAKNYALTDPNAFIEEFQEKVNHLYTNSV
jgi:AraC-like DNA-binding protein